MSAPSKTPGDVDEGCFLRAVCLLEVKDKRKIHRKTRSVWPDKKKIIIGLFDVFNSALFLCLLPCS